MRTSGLFPSNLDPFVFALGLRGELLYTDTFTHKRPCGFRYHYLFVKSWVLELFFD